METVTSPIAGSEPAPARKTAETQAGEYAPGAVAKTPETPEIRGDFPHEPEHACRKPGFNAMVDTCPQCVPGSSEGVKAEANDKPYRHVVASRWLVHSLLQYHYLPYWPRNVDQVFATVDIRTGKVIAACVFAFPVLRCHLREQVFGELSPETLNRDFRQLVRWMVHPDHRAESVGSELLRWALTKVPAPVVEAINRSWVPVKVFKELGMIERSDGDRHYYYRLKECRKREDEIANPPAQAQPVKGEVMHEYPRMWWPKLHLEGQPRFVFVQPYEGSPIRTHAWHGQSYTVLYDPQVSLEKLAKSDAMEEVHDPEKRSGLLNRIAGGLPVMNLG